MSVSHKPKLRISLSDGDSDVVLGAISGEASKPATGTKPTQSGLERVSGLRTSAKKTQT